MTLRELQQLVALGEGVSLEFKRRVPRAPRIAKEVVALANTHGGRILLGVADDGTITGVSDASEEAFAFDQAVAQYTAPPVPYRTERIVIAPGRDVLLVVVPESDQKPHRLLNAAAAGDGTPYVRVKEMSVEASDESVRLMQAGDATNGVTFAFGETESLLMRYLDDYGRITVAQFAQLADVSTDEASVILVRLVRADVLRLHADRGADYFTLRY
ncbi:RNA-binding domain-containing protein [Salisaeta longa]|uniref:RNA-binding domain-containing protein n=1 Tax=Salisaeta longa TaxID=503170 RepID=UPI0003B36AC5|nr:RNA-binding domain-containing protein [Salisaeta longa]